MPVFSLPGKYGAGGFGKECYDFIDYLARAGQKVWQVLPLVQTGYGNSPYSSVSSESFSPYFISPEILKERGLLTEEELSFAVSGGGLIDYGFLYSSRYPLLRKAFSRFDKNEKDFCEYVNAGESRDYAFFMAIKYASGQKPFVEWQEGLKRRDERALAAFAADYGEEILFWQFLQYEAQREWRAVKAYANRKGIKIIGDMPLYVAADSVDVWKNPGLFMLDKDYSPVKVAGVPPDYFQPEGQLWGNPVYDYSAHKKQNFCWWAHRIDKALSVYDCVRIDHFRGLDRFYAVSPTADNAKNGEWIDVPSEELFAAIHKKRDKSGIIAEDLGIIDDGVRELLKHTGYPGMKVLSFAFNGEPQNPYLPERIEKNSVCYTGTHDNDALMGLIKNASEWDYENMKRGVQNSAEILLGKALFAASDKELAETIIELGFASAADTFILPMQDVLLKDSSYRINEPGTVKPQNWAVRFCKEDFTAESAERLYELAVKYNRS